jgi:hypothetical protein
MAYVKKVTRHAYKTTDTNVDGLKGCGLSKGEVLEATRVAELFNDIYRWGSVTKMIELVAS